MSVVLPKYASCRPVWWAKCCADGTREHKKYFFLDPHYPPPRPPAGSDTEKNVFFSKVIVDLDTFGAVERPVVA